MSAKTDQVKLGHTTLPDDIREKLRKAVRLEWISVAWLCVTITAVILTMGSSQAMKAAWLEDLLSFLPPLSFLISTRVARRQPNDKHPYGFHRAVGAGHLAASLALLAMGAFLILDSGMTIIKQEHPTIGTVRLFGTPVWQGWLMIGVMIVTNIPTIILGRMKMKLAEPLHDKILYADADMNKADWQSAGGAVLGLAAVGFGLWWADSAVAIFIAGSIVHDGWTNVKAAVAALLDAQARTPDDKKELPLIGKVEAWLDGTEWVGERQVRMRDMGRLLHTEVLVVPTREVSREELKRLAEDLRGLDWKLEDLVVAQVTQIPHTGGE